MANNDIERRFTSDVMHGHRAGLSTRDAGPPRVIEGYAAVFFKPSDIGTSYRLSPQVEERVETRAFDRAIREGGDVLAAFQHDHSVLLGRTSSGTLRLQVDQRGLKYQIDVDLDDPDHQRIIAKLRRGDLRGSSFAFKTRQDRFEKRSDGVLIRWLQDVDLVDVGPVVNAAYASATAAARSVQQRFEKQQRWRLTGDHNLDMMTMTLAVAEVEAACVKYRA